MAHIPEFQLTGESKQVIKDIVKSNDHGNKGYVTIDELADCLSALGFTPDDEDVEFLVKHMDDDGDGTLEVDEVLGNIEVINYHCFYGKALMAEFRSIDKDKDGVIRFPEMLKVLTTRGEQPLEPLDARRLLDQLARKFDANFDGKFSYTEFVKIYMSDILPYKDELQAGTFKVGDYADLVEEKKKKPLKKKAKSTVDMQSSALQKAREDAASGAKPKPERTDSSASLPGYMRPKGGGTRSSAESSDSLPGYMRPKTGGRAEVRPKTGAAPSSDNLPGYMRPKTGGATRASAATTTNYDNLPGYMRPKTGAIRNRSRVSNDKP